MRQTNVLFIFMQHVDELPMPLVNIWTLLDRVDGSTLHNIRISFVYVKVLIIDWFTAVISRYSKQVYTDSND